jgi:hypothetical protein
VLIPGYKNVGKKHNINIANRSIEDVATFKNLGTTLTDQNCVQEEFKNRLNSGNACYHSVQSTLYFRLMSRNVKIEVKRKIQFCQMLCIVMKHGVSHSGKSKECW